MVLKVTKTTGVEDSGGVATEPPWPAYYNSLLALFGQIFQILQPHSEFLIAISTAFPGSIYLARNWISLNSNDFERFVSFSKCDQLYPSISDLVYERNGVKYAKTCDNILSSKGTTHKRCGNQLLKKSILRDGIVSFMPLKHTVITH